MGVVNGRGETEKGRAWAFRMITGSGIIISIWRLSPDVSEGGDHLCNLVRFFC